MELKSVNGGQETLCLKVNKVYDWVTRQSDVPLISFNASDLGTTLFFDCPENCISPSPCGTESCAILGNSFTVDCFVTDEDGNPIDPLAPGSILCTELHSQKDGQVEHLLCQQENCNLTKSKSIKERLCGCSRNKPSGSSLPI